MALFDQLKSTGRTGVYYYRHATRKFSATKDRCFVLRYSLKGKRHTETFGWETEGKTLVLAEIKLAELKAAAKSGQGPTTLAEEREIREAHELRTKQAKEAEERARLNRPTFSMLWEHYSQTLTKSLNTDLSNFTLHLGPIHSKTPDELLSLDIERIHRNLKKKGRSPQTVAHCLRLITRLTNYGLDQTPPLCTPLPFRVKLPKVDNIVTETLTPDEHARLLGAIAADLDKDPWTGRAMLLALTTGMRRGELLRLQWKDIDLDFGFIELRETKSGKTQRIPINTAAQGILEDTPRTASAYVFPGKDGGQRSDLNRGTRRIAKAAQLPEGFRPLHGLRHHYATTLASSGKVTPQALQKLLTHASFETTQRYTHLSDTHLQEAAETASDLLQAKPTNVIPLTASGSYSSKT
ncbi:MAG: site-specific integrase [Desulfuromonadaceae bacterium]|nr:site-specific integrase [Desulfuromonadaceae bacterium]